MKEIVKACWKVLNAGGCAPLLVFVTHVFIGQVLNLYELWPPTDIPMHFLGGAAIAYFISQCFQTLPRESVQRSRVIVLELLLIGSLTATSTIFWEFAEFTLDQLAGTNVQIGLANTIKDMAVGILGAIGMILIRARQLRAGTQEIKELTLDWVKGKAA